MNRRLSDTVSQAWDDLPDTARQGLMKWLDRLPGGLKAWRGLVDQAAEHVMLAAGDKHTVAILGPANAGKSTLYNLLIHPGQAPAAVSAVPGTTRVASAADAGVFQIVDTPGADAVGSVGEDERQRAMAAGGDADLVVLLLDATHGVREPERQLLRDVRGLDRPFLMALNKMDVIPAKDAAAVVGKAAGDLGVSSDEIIALSARKGTGVERLLAGMVRSEPAIVAALGRALPAYRWSLSQTVIARSASAAAAIAVTPLPFVDFLPLLGVQTAMVISIARIYTYRITLSRARELVATFGAAVLGRTLFYELSKLGGPPGWLVAAGVAVGTTAALGYASAVWFERGARLAPEDIRKIARATSESVVDRLKDLGRRRPKRVTLKERVDRALQDLPEPDTDSASSPAED
ncbi:MAG: GTPase [Anaerolineales bacterium]|jgi:small GTP-binding protein